MQAQWEEQQCCDSFVILVGTSSVESSARRWIHSCRDPTEDCRACPGCDATAASCALNADSDYSRRLWPALFSLTVERIPVACDWQISDFETIRPQIEQLKAGNSCSLLGKKNRLLMFALSSGTTAESKFIPITSDFLSDYRRGWNLWGINAFDAHPKLHSSYIVQLSSDYDLFRTAGGFPCGNISGLVSKTQSPIIRMVYTVPYAVSQDQACGSQALYRTAVVDSKSAHRPGHDGQSEHIGSDRETGDERKRRTDSRHCRRHAVWSNGNSAMKFEQPSIVTNSSSESESEPESSDNIVARTGHLHPRDFWPNLNLAAVWTGGSASAYLDTMRRFYGDVAVRDHGLSASEGRMTIPFADGSSLGVLDIGSHFFEFIPEDEYDSSQPTILEAHELEEGRNYFILLTTVSGLYRYDIRDVVRCQGFQGTTPRLEFLHKGASISNVTGEKLTESRVVFAVKQWRSPPGNGTRLLYRLSPVWGDPPRLSSAPRRLSGHPPDTTRVVGGRS